MRAVKNKDTPIIEGYRLYYNFIKPHESLNGYTPAEVANIYLNLGDKKWEKLLMQSIRCKNGEVDSE